MSLPVRNLLIFLFCITLLRIFYIGQFDLTPDEAYYWTWSLVPDWCYYDQPAGIAWANAFFTTLFGTTVWGIRMGAVVLGLIGTLFVFLIAKKADFSDREAAWSAALVHIIPIFASGHILMLHDVVMICALSATIWALMKSIFEGGRFWWILTGALAALSVYGKFSAVLIGIGVALFLLCCKRKRSLLATSGPYLSIGTAAVLVFPIISWNIRNEWIALLAVRDLSHQEGLTLTGRVINVFDFLGSQVGLISPVFLVMMVLAALFAAKRINQEKYAKEALLACLFFGVVGYFLFQTIGAKVQGNWAAMTYLPGTLLMVRHWSRRLEQNNRNWRIAGKVGFALAVLTTVIFMLQPVVRIIPMPVGLDLTDQVHGWKELGERVEAELKKRPDLILAARRYQIAGEMIFYTNRKKVEVANFSTRGNQFDVWNNWARLEGRSVLYVDLQGKAGKLWRHFEKATPLPDFIRSRKERKIQAIHMTILENFHYSGDLEEYFENPVAYSAKRIKRVLARKD